MLKEDKIRVLQCVSNMDRAGIETMLMNYYRNIDRDLIQFDFLCNKPNIGAYEEEINNMGGRIYVTPGLNPLKWFKYQKYMKNFFEEHKEYKIIHCQNEAMGFPALLAAKKSGIQVRISHSHNTTTRFDFKWPIKILYKYLLKKVATDCVACGIDAGKYLFGEEVKTINNAIEINKFLYNEGTRNELRKKYGVEDKVVIGNVARFEPQKNHKFLVDVFKKYNEINANSVLLLIGDGTSIGKIKNYVKKLNLEQNVIFTGSISNVSDMYQMMDVFVLPSLHEGLPVVGVEAQYSGLPCLFSDKITKEIKICDCSKFLGLNIKDWVDELLKISVNSRTKSKINNNNYDIKHASKNIEKYYNTLLERGKKLKIAMIGQKRTFFREGGIEVVVENISVSLAKLGHDVTCYDRKNKKYSNYEFVNGVKIKPTFTIEKKSTDALVCSLLSSFKVLFGKYDVIHYHGIGPSIFLLIPKLFGKKVVVTVHGLNYKTPKWKGIGEKMMKLGEYITAHFSDEIIVLSKEQQKYFKNKYNRKTIYIPNGMNIQDEKNDDNIFKKWGIRKNEYILFLSRVVPGKGLEYLLDAYRTINSNYKLVIAGGSEYVDDFYQYIINKSKLDERVILTGYVEKEIAYELYSNTRLFVFPSEAEGMPMCLLEAMSFNAPCLVSDIEENKEVGLNYIEYFKSKDVDDLKNKLESILKVEKKENTLLKKHVKNNYLWEKIVLDTINVYRGVL